MFRPPKLWKAHLDELVAGVGGPHVAIRMLAINPRTLRRWYSGSAVPKMALELLWYAGPQGRAAAEADMHFASNIEHTKAFALELEIRKLRKLLAAYELNGPPARSIQEPALAVNDEHGAVPPTPPGPHRKRVCLLNRRSVVGVRLKMRFSGRTYNFSSPRSHFPPMGTNIRHLSADGW